jgi:chemotaxis protein histidine kinase CheA
VFGKDHATIEGEKCVLVLNKSDQIVAVEVDEIIGKEQVVVKPLGDALQTISYLSGTSILGNGDLAFLLDVLKLKQLYASKE